MRLKKVMEADLAAVQIVGVGLFSDMYSAAAARQRSSSSAIACGRSQEEIRSDDLKAFVQKNLRFEFVFAQILYRIRLQNAI